MKNYTAQEVSVVKKLMKTTKDVVMQRKYLVIHLHMGGHKNKDIAEIVDLNVQTVGIYIKTYDTQGIPGLTPKKSNGRPTFLTKEQGSWLYTVISTKTPDEVGFDGFKNWTAKIACQLVSKEFGIKYSINGMLDLFHRLKLSYTRPTYVLSKADTEKQNQFKSDFGDVKKNF